MFDNLVKKADSVWDIFVLMGGIALFIFLITAAVVSPFVLGGWLLIRAWGC